MCPIRDSQRPSLFLFFPRLAISLGTWHTQLRPRTGDRESTPLKEFLYSFHPVDYLSGSSESGRGTRHPRLLGEWVTGPVAAASAPSEGRGLLWGLYGLRGLSPFYLCAAGPVCLVRLQNLCPRCAHSVEWSPKVGFWPFLVGSSESREVQSKNHLPPVGTCLDDQGGAPGAGWSDGKNRGTGVRQVWD